MPARPGDDATSRVVALDWHLEIFGFQPRPARVVARPRSTARRALSAAAALLIGCTLAPLAMNVTPALTATGT